MDVMQTASASRQTFRDPLGVGAIVFDPVRLQQATPQLFDPSRYGPDARPVADGQGRGAAWFVSGEFGEGVLRHYRRGGWAARLSRETYLWQSEAKVRSIHEFNLLQELRRLELPVATPIAASYQRRWLGYRAAILVQAVEQARSFAEAVGSAGLDAPWATVGQAIGRCHRQLARHADLNANNILLDPREAVWLIDWDKGAIESGPGPWRQRVLDRLQRSLAKECQHLPPDQLREGMQRLVAAHDRELQ